MHLSTFHIYKYICQSDVHTKTHSTLNCTTKSPGVASVAPGAVVNSVANMVNLCSWEPQAGAWYNVRPFPKPLMLWCYKYCYPWSLHKSRWHQKACVRISRMCSLIASIFALRKTRAFRSKCQQGSFSPLLASIEEESFAVHLCIHM